MEYEVDPSQVPRGSKMTPGWKGVARRIKNHLSRTSVFLRGIGPGSADRLKFQCNICGSQCRAAITALGRETPSCAGCGSTVRMRALIYMLSMELFGEGLTIPNFPSRPDIKGIGMSDWDGYAIPLTKKVRHKNTYYHREPKLDITSIDTSLEGDLDFIISSDVFEHVVPPVSVAFENARKLLKSNGVLIFTVPYVKDGRTREHFPDLYDFEIAGKGKSRILKNRTKEGIEQLFDNLVFHGGDGSTLEMRVFSESSLIKEFHGAGFNNVKIYRDQVDEFGIIWEHDWSLPVAARIDGGAHEKNRKN